MQSRSEIYNMAFKYIQQAIDNISSSSEMSRADEHKLWPPADTRVLIELKLMSIVRIKPERNSKCGKLISN
jgi:hypothetical protein